MKEIDNQEWKIYVTKCTSGEWPVPPAFVSDKDNWICRAIVGRVLYFIKDTEGAMRVLSTFINDVKPDMEDHPEQGMCEAEHFVLSLRDIAEIIWTLTKNGPAALQYLDRAFDICMEFPYRFHTEARGDIWYRRLNILAESGKLEQAVADAEEMVKNEKQESHAPKPIIPDPLYDGVNPYIFYSLRFLAEQKQKEGKTEKACALFEEAYKYFPLSAAGVRDVNKAKETKDWEEQYKAWVFCTTLQYLPWEKQPVVKLRD